MKIACLLLLGSWLLLACGVNAQSQPAQQSGDQAKPDQSTPKDSAKPKKTGVPRETPAKAPADSSASASTSTTPAAKPTAVQQSRPANGGGMVWVNTESRVYHKPGSRYYGKTKQGKYMTEADAIKAGYHAAKKE
jgi:hypothetical protein